MSLCVNRRKIPLPFKQDASLAGKRSSSGPLRHQSLLIAAQPLRIGLSTTARSKLSILQVMNVVIPFSGFSSNSAFHRPTRSFFVRLLVVLTLLASLGLPANAANSFSDSAVRRAAAFVDTKSRGEFVLGHLHMFATYRGHKYRETLRVTNSTGAVEPGKFALVYRYYWNDDDYTDLAYFFDAKGGFDGVQAMRSTAIIQQPFAIAELSIKLLGNVLVEAFRDNLSPGERASIQQMIDSADVKGLLETALTLQQTLGT